MKNIFTVLFLTIISVSTFSYGQAYYLGVGAPGDPIRTSCASCHVANGYGPPVYDEWKGTVHSWAMDSLASTLGYSCLPCHNTGWNVYLDNYGADEYVDSTDNNGYIITDSTGFNRVKNVQCETCHGPMGTVDHQLNNDVHFSTTLNKPDYSAELCGRCHEGEHHPYYEEWEESLHAQSAIPAVINNKRCVRCHIAQNFALYAKDPANYRDTILVTGNDIQPLTCVACHDPHNAQYEGQLRFPITQQSTVCDQCHTGEIDSVNVRVAPHHTTSECLSGSPLFGYRYPDSVYSNSAHTYVATKRCVNCHVYMSPFNPVTGVAATGHTFEPRVEACAQAQCHGQDYYTASGVDTSNADLRFNYHNAQVNTLNLINQLYDKLQQANAYDSTTDAFWDANYNYQSAISEGSNGVHNTLLVQKLLRDAIANFSPATAVKEENNNTPNSYSLSQNYPNPFNPSTTIKFSIPKAGNVTITVYDAIGNEVSKLVNKYMAAGNYSTRWDASHFASGIYFYRIEANNFVKVKKMILIK